MRRICGSNYKNRHSQIVIAGSHFVYHMLAFCAQARFYPPRIPTVIAPVFVTMYYFHPFRLAKSSIAKQNVSHRVNAVCNGSPSRIRSVRRISLGITTRPRSSILLTIPVAFMVASSNTVSICSVWLQSYCLQRKEKYSVPGKDTLCVASGRDRAVRGRALRLRGGFLLPQGLDETPPGHVK